MSTPTLTPRATAASVATSDREATADLVLAQAMHEARALIRDGRPGRAKWVLTRAGLSADRILGGAA